MNDYDPVEELDLETETTEDLCGDCECCGKFAVFLDWRGLCHKCAYEKDVLKLEMLCDECSLYGEC